MEELFERFETIHFILSHKFASWKGSLSPAEFDYFSHLFDQHCDI